MCFFGLGLLAKAFVWSEILFFSSFLTIGFAGICLWIGMLSYSKDVSPRNASLASALINAPFDSSVLIFLGFALLNTYVKVPLWAMFVCYGVGFGVVTCIFSVFMEPAKIKAVDSAVEMELGDLAQDVDEMSHGEDFADEVNLVPVDAVPHEQDSTPTIGTPSSPTITTDDASLLSTHRNDNFDHPTPIILPPHGSVSVAPQSKFPVDPDRAMQKAATSPRDLLLYLDLRKLIPFRDLFSFEMIIFHIIQALTVTQSNLYQSTIIEQAMWITGGNKERALMMNTVFVVLLPVMGTLISLVVGPMLSRVSILVAATSISAGWMIWNLLSLIAVENLWYLQFLTYLFFICSRALFFILLSALVYSSYEQRKSTVIFSSIVTFSGMGAVGFSYLGNWFVVRVFGGSFFVVNTVYGGVTGIFLIVFCYCAVRLDRRNKKALELEELQDFDLEDSGDEVAKEDDFIQEKLPKDEPVQRLISPSATETT